MKKYLATTIRKPTFWLNLFFTGLLVWWVLSLNRTHLQDTHLLINSLRSNYGSMVTFDNPIPKQTSVDKFTGVILWVQGFEYQTDPSGTTSQSTIYNDRYDIIKEPIKHTLDVPAGCVGFEMKGHFHTIE